MDEYLLTGLDLGAVNQPFPRGDDDQRNRSCFSHAKRRRLARQQVRVHRGEFCQRALQPADTSGQPVDLIAFFETGDARSRNM
jgi:hypothetical protein